jgi:tetratricopeptide (TPR) repeat protein
MLPPSATKLGCGAGDVDVRVVNGPPHAADQALKKGIELDPSNPTAYLDLGQLYSELALYDQEISVYEKLLQRDSSVAVAYSYLATAIVAKYQVEIGYRSMGKEPAKDNVIIDKAMSLFDRSLGVVSINRVQFFCSY